MKSMTRADTLLQQLTKILIFTTFVQADAAVCHITSDTCLIKLFEFKLA